MFDFFVPFYTVTGIMFVNVSCDCKYDVHVLMRVIGHECTWTITFK